jgi:hypothetical protein
MASERAQCGDVRYAKRHKVRLKLTGQYTKGQLVRYAERFENRQKFVRKALEAPPMLKPDPGFDVEQGKPENV